MKPNRILGLLLGFATGIFVSLIITQSARASCPASCWSRSCGRTYALSALDEPYSVTHEEWVIGSETGTGVDCSGLVYKAWAMEGYSGSTDFEWYTTDEVIGLRYQASGFWSECLGACPHVCYGGSGTCPMSMTSTNDIWAVLKDTDGFTDNHVGIIYREISNGSDEILEAGGKDSDEIVRLREWDWRSKTGYKARRRAVWSSSCSPCKESCP